MNRPLLALVLAASALVRPVLAQDDAIVLGQYEPVNLPANDLINAVSRMTRQWDERPEIFWLGERIFVFGRAGVVQRVVEALRTLDEATGNSERVVLRTYELRYVSADRVLAALEPLRRDLDASPDAEAPNVSLVPGANRIVVRDKQAYQDQIAALIESIDVPAAVEPTPEALLTIWILRGRSEAGPADERVPEALRADLPRLLPYPRFEVLGVELLRIRAGIGESAALSMDLDQDGSAKVDLDLGPYDAARKSVVLRTCRFDCLVADGQAKRRVEFRTAATLPDGRFTVIGAAGKEPVLLVLEARIEEPK